MYGIGGCRRDSLSWGNPFHSLAPKVITKKYTTNISRDSPKSPAKIVYSTMTNKIKERSFTLSRNAAALYVNQKICGLELLIEQEPL